jgi:hypothetical protein
MASKTNVQTVRDMMEVSDYGAMAQLFIMDAISKSARKVAAMSLEEVREAFGVSSAVNPDAWHGVAREIARKLGEAGY